ncbi:MAG: hypothetical protein M1816_004353 [Peltula sp. TS41687]|nr:MAG: hypothetical protein M1816_004353 [Peltula sp. TS41687]
MSSSSESHQVDTPAESDSFLDEGPSEQEQKSTRIKGKQSSGRLSSLASGSGRAFLSPMTSPSRRYGHRSRASMANYLHDIPNSGRSSHVDGHMHFDGTKVRDYSIEWYVEGPGRRVGYDDMTAIDWIFEYTKERQRLKVLRSTATGVFGYLRQLLDASQVWAVLIATGLAAGIIAACIDITSDWLGDLKTGYCKHGPGGGKFYLNKGFCCWGLEEWSQCQDWTPWSTAFRLNSKAGKYMSEYTIFTLYSVAFAAGASVLVKAYAIYARHSGIPEIKTVLGGFVIQRFMGAWTLLCLAVASGLWLGKEGPLVHVACCCADLIMKLFDNLDKNEARKREVLSAAAAAGISVAFGSPIGGVLFSLEQLSYYFPDRTMWQSFVCAMLAAVTLQAINPFRTGKLVLYQVTYTRGWHDFEIVPYALLGVLGGLYGGSFIRLNMRIAQWRKAGRLMRGPVIEVIIVALVTAMINYPNVFMRAQSSELVYSLFAECSKVPDDQFGLCKTGTGILATIILLLLAASLGFGLASVTFGLQIPAGIILPSMAIGALYGRALGIAVEAFQHAYPHLIIFSSCEADVPCVTPGTYAIIGAASALGGVTRMTVSIVVIMFELTGALTYVLPIMIAVMISKWVGDAMGKQGIYESWIQINEYPFLDNRDDGPNSDLAVSEIMTRVEDLVVLTASGHTIHTLSTLLSTQPYRGFPVVSDSHDAILLGYISRAELSFALNSAMTPPRSLPVSTEAYFSHQPFADGRPTLDLRPWMDQTPFTLSSKSSLQLTANLFQKLGLRYVLFCDRGTLQGLLTKKDLWYVLNGGVQRRAVNESGLPGEGPGEERGLLGGRHSVGTENEEFGQ